MSSQEPQYNTPPADTSSSTPPALIAFTLGILVVCFVAFSIACLCKYCFSSVFHTWAFQRTASGTLVGVSPNNSSPATGLDPSLLAMFPTFPYSSVKDLRKQKYSLECAICLLEFEDDSMLRLLTLCCHVFHQDCIDLWLGSHKTCPVCRRDLHSTTTNETEKNRDLAHTHVFDDGVVSLASDNEVCIDVREAEESDKGDAGVGDQRQYQHQHEPHEHKEREKDCNSRFSLSVSVSQQDELFARSHSTGHSIVMIREDEGKEEDRHTLRLPQQRVIRGRRNCTRSCASFKDMTRYIAPCSNCGFVQPLHGSSPLGHGQKS